MLIEGCSQKRFLAARRACPSNGAMALQAWFWNQLPSLLNEASALSECGVAHVEACVFDSLDGVKDYLDELHGRHLLGLADTLLSDVLRNDLFTVVVHHHDGGYYVVRMEW